MAKAAGSDGVWQRGAEAGRRLEEMLREKSPVLRQIADAVRELTDRHAKLCKRVGDRSADVLSFGPGAHTLQSVLEGFQAAQEWLCSDECDLSSEVCLVSVDRVCRAVLVRRIDLLEVMLETLLKRGERDSGKVIASVVSKLKNPEIVQRACEWWSKRFADSLMVPYDDFWETYCGDYGKHLQSDGRISAEWKSALQKCVDYTLDGCITVHEYAFFCIWWFPTLHDGHGFSPRHIALLLKQAYYRPLCDRKNFHLFLKAPGDFCVRNTVNQGGGWCISYVTQHQKAQHTLLTIRDGLWVFPSAKDQSRETSKSLIALINLNSDVLQIPRGERFDELPTVAWDGYTLATQEEEDADTVGGQQ
eukprot:TRINITY_DN36816_c0_g1_i1.p1 TRINITY_DN36816_c0_g1~~TRINITY_DN36816_c0_g1_i1.p1  ORF type:complete len:381 (+),score=107.41 TRINITY_DN36816_c0_g1_i1:62-1144(+)